MLKFRNHPAVAPINRFVSEQPFQTLLVLFASIVFVFFTSKEYIPFAARLFVPFVLLFLVTTADMRLRAILLFWVVLGLLLNIWANFFVSANHGFMITYIGLALMISAASGEKACVTMARAAVFLISILMGLALIQKLVSTHYMSGDLIGTYLVEGQMFKVLISVVYPDWPQIVHQNIENQRTLLAAVPNGVDSIAITVPPMIKVLAVLLTYCALFSQAALEVFVLLRARFGIWTHYAIMVFVLIIYATRNENIFLSMNLLLGYAMTDESTKSARIWYVLGVAYLLIMEMMGLRFGLFG